MNFGSHGNVNLDFMTRRRLDHISTETRSYGTFFPSVLLLKSVFFQLRIHIIVRNRVNMSVIMNWLS